ncbi:unnamed protein product [Protopolystoma xenopodis]|uniref:Uncharacterized protein n=1 Tax=Protopolystoma xenopodis TaxID=117903 RepID=A0A3S5CG16_9PLAT|nr:unnamed protein product [Protopolystoma xenopodis]
MSLDFETALLRFQPSLGLISTFKGSCLSQDGMSPSRQTAKQPNSSTCRPPKRYRPPTIPLSSAKRTDRAESHLPVNSTVLPINGFCTICDYLQAYAITTAPLGYFGDPVPDSRMPSGAVNKPGNQSPAWLLQVRPSGVRWSRNSSL